ncbi:hypothetical protein Dsin_028370 [Dipteronia sinensis]|uniref:RING-type domain-containing protein n=1 Tax=Dipteronia sinensis TaxID=43782 RepID=A0AAD9ZQP9_9ROSI|nr:hypothetical protein Dsin_028370 [Dipteronia sinensis]
MLSTSDIVNLCLYFIVVFMCLVGVVYKLYMWVWSNEWNETQNNDPIDIERGGANNRAGGRQKQTFLKVSWRSDETNYRECAICLDEFSDGEECRVGSRCEHLFHKYCIDPWLLKERRCPLCRVPGLIQAEVKSEIQI